MEINEKNEISLVDLLKIAVKWIYLIMAGVIIFGIGMYIYSENFVVPQYEASTKYCIQTRGQSIESDVLDSQRTVAYAQLVLGTYIDILNTRDFSEKIAERLNNGVSDGQSAQNDYVMYIPEGKTYSADGIKKMITYKSEEEKISFDVSVKSGSYEEAYAIARCIENTASDYIEEKYPGVGVVTVIDKAILSDKPVNNRTLLLTLAGALMGAIIAFLVAYIVESADTRIKDEITLGEKTGLAVIGIIPDMNIDNSGRKQTEERK